MPFVTPRTWVAGEYPTAAQLNQDLRDNVAFLSNPPSCRVYHNAHVATTSGVQAALPFNSERWDTDNMHSTVTNNTRITFNTAGRYLIGGNVTFQSNGTGERLIDLILNTGVIIGSSRVVTNLGGGPETNLNLNVIWTVTAGQWVELRSYQNSGGALNVTTSVGHAWSPEFWAHWLATGL